MFEKDSERRKYMDLFCEIRGRGRGEELRILEVGFVFTVYPAA